MKSAILILFVAMLASPAWAASDFFKIEDIRYLAKPPRDGSGIWILGDRKTKKEDVFVPSLEVRLSAAQSIRTQGLTIKAHFFDGQRKLVQTLAAPSPARTQAKSRLYSMPVLLAAEKPDRVFFKLPDELIGKKWNAVVVFGDRHEVTALQYPGDSMFGLVFPEKEFSLKSPAQKVVRKEALDPVVQHVVKTNNPKHPQITLFLRFPNNAKDGSEVDGVLAMCVLADSVEEIRRRLQAGNAAEYGGLFHFADRHRFAILCWGARTIWRPDASYDELERETNIELDRSFDLVAGAWERGILDLNKKYNLPTRNFLLWGVCASAQWAHRLVLRKPDHFLAAYIHIPSSFDQPTPDAAKVLWLLTTGELDGGYQHGVRWYQDCRAAGYPIIYKPIVGLGHAGSPISDNLGMKFFEYALTLRDQRAELDKTWEEFKKSAKERQPWVASFRQPEFVGDYLNQEVFPYAKKDLVPAGFRVPLPTKTLADAWNK